MADTLFDDEVTYTPTDDELVQQREQEVQDRLSQKLMEQIDQRFTALQNHLPKPQQLPAAPVDSAPAPRIAPLVVDPDKNAAGISMDAIRDAARDVIKHEIVDRYGATVEQLKYEQDIKAAQSVANQHLPELAQTVGDENAGKLLYNLMYSAANPHYGATDDQGAVKALQWAIDQAKVYAPSRPSESQAPMFTGEGEIPRASRPGAPISGHQTGMRPTNAQPHESWMSAKDGSVHKITFPNLQEYQGRLGEYERDMEVATRKYEERRRYAEAHNKNWQIEIA